MYVVAAALNCALLYVVGFSSLILDGQLHLSNIVHVYTPNGMFECFGFLFYNVVLACECLVAGWVALLLLIVIAPFPAHMNPRMNLGLT